MKYRKFNKYEKKEIRAEQVKKAMAGSGLYLYENNTKGDLSLPRPTKSGLRNLGVKQQFQGDDYYMQMVKTNDLKLIKVIQTPMEEKMANEKLILDQPDTITEQGKVEHVVKQPLKKMNEGDSNEPQKDVLINEDPVGDSFVIMG